MPYTDSYFTNDPIFLKAVSWGNTPPEETVAQQMQHFWWRMEPYRQPRTVIGAMISLVNYMEKLSYAYDEMTRKQRLEEYYNLFIRGKCELKKLERRRVKCMALGMAETEQKKKKNYMFMVRFFSRKAKEAKRLASTSPAKRVRGKTQEGSNPSASAK